MMGLASPPTDMYRSHDAPSLPFKTVLLIRLKRVEGWLTQERHRRYVHVLWARTLDAFTLHPAETSESYLQHLWFTAKTSMRFVVIATVLFVHGVFPFLFKRTTSLQIERVYLLMRSRIPKTRRDAIDSEYTI
jgi:hypothetical protein